MFYKILDQKRFELLPLFGAFKKRFYLAGGTGLALQMGHRDSIDFDFFCLEEIDTKKLFYDLKKIFQKHSLLIIQEERNTLTVLIDENVRCSFFSYPYPFIKKPHQEEYLVLASMEDIGCMKLSAITGRASNKDYVDLYFILQEIRLDVLLRYAAKKFPDVDLNLFLKSLVYFDDIRVEPILFKDSRSVDFETVKHFLQNQVKSIHWWRA